MTASSVQLLSSCRVQLVGLPQSTGSSSRTSTTNTAARPRGDVISSIPQRVSRNLFGAPKPGEVKELLHKETLQRSSYFRQRYNFDILRSPPADSGTVPDTESRSASITTADRHLECLPDLILKELLEHAERLDEEDQRTSSHTPLSTNSAATIACSSKFKKAGQVRRTVASINACDSYGGASNASACASVQGTPQSQGNERLKPYARQTLLTDCYSLRKTVQTTTGNSSGASISNEQNNPQQQLEVLQLPKSIRTVVSCVSTNATSIDSVKDDAISSLTEDLQKHPVQ